MKKMALNRCPIVLIFTLFLFSFPFSSAHGRSLFAAPRDYGVQEGPWSVATGDFDGDMILDLATANSYGTVSILLGKGNGAFQEAVHYFTNVSDPRSAATGDFDGDMILDLAVTGGWNYKNFNLAILLGVGDGSFQEAVDHSVDDFAFSVTTGDFDGDMILDLAVTSAESWDFTRANSFSDKVSILLGVGDGTFQTAVEYGTGDDPTSVAIGDFDGDMILDLATANHRSNDVSILLGVGDGTFQTAVEYCTGDNPTSVTTGDFDGDMIPDLAVTCLINYYFGGVSILFGAGDGSFQEAAHYGTGSLPDSAAIGDFDGDMILDLAVTCARWSGMMGVSIFLGAGDGTFQFDSHYITSGYVTSVATGDFDGDLALDLAVVNRSNDNVSVLINNTGSCFIETVMK